MRKRISKVWKIGTKWSFYSDKNLQHDCSSRCSTHVAFKFWKLRFNTIQELKKNLNFESMDGKRSGVVWLEHAPLTRSPRAASSLVTLQAYLSSTSLIARNVFRPTRDPPLWLSYQKSKNRLMTDQNWWVVIIEWLLLIALSTHSSWAEQTRIVSTVEHLFNHLLHAFSGALYTRLSKLVVTISNDGVLYCSERATNC